MRYWLSILSFVVVGLCLDIVAAQTPKPPAPLNVQVELTVDVKAKKAKAGDSVVALTMVPVTLPNGTAVPAGSKVLGHVLQAEADSGEAHTSYISLSFENIEVKKGQTVPVHCFVLAAMMPALTSATGQQQGQAVPPMQMPAPAGSGGPMGGYGMGGGSMGGGNMGGTMGGSAATMPAPSGPPPEDPKPVTAHTGEVIGMRGVELQVTGPNHVSTFRSSHKNLDLYERLQMILVVQP